MKKKCIIALLSAAAMLTAGAVYWFQFDSTGYRMSIPVRSDFTEMETHVYADAAFAEKCPEALDLLHEAKARVEEFWKANGANRLWSDPYIIFSADKDNLQKLGGDHDTRYSWVPVRRSYVCISDEYLDLDILAHELTHAEFQSRLSYRAMKQEIPTWFDEGLAVQNDYRAQYSEAEWEKQTDHGKNTVLPEDMDTPEEFYAGEAADRRFRYLCAAHLVRSWLPQNRPGWLVQMLTYINDGQIGFPNSQAFTRK